MKCSKCGNEIAEESKFCEFCGTKTIKQECKIYVGWILLIGMLFMSLLNFVFWLINDYGTAWRLSYNYLIVLQCVILLVGLTMFFLKKIRAPLLVLLCIQFMIGAILCWDVIEHSSHSEIGSTVTNLYKNDYDTHIKLKISPTTEENVYADIYSHTEAVEKLRDFVQEISTPNSKYRINSSFWQPLQSYIWWYHTFIFAWMDLALVLLYFIYALIAYKKGWPY